jgi:hypothetical protein
MSALQPVSGWVPPGDAAYVTPSQRQMVLHESVSTCADPALPYLPVLLHRGPPIGRLASQDAALCCHTLFVILQCELSSCRERAGSRLLAKYATMLTCISSRHITTGLHVEASWLWRLGEDS